MDLNSLPSEMLESVVKYMEFSTLFQMRKINNRIDKIAKKAGLTRVPVNNLGIYKYSSDGYRIKVYLDSGIVNYFALHESDHTYTVNELELVLSFSNVIGNIQILSIFFLIEDIVFNNELLSVVLKNKEAFRKLESLCFFKVKLTLSDHELKKFMNISRQLKRIELYGGQVCNVLVNKKILEGRKWTSIYLLLVPDGLVLKNLNDQFLLDVVVNCGNFSLFEKNTETNFTLRGVISFWKIIYSNIEDYLQINLGKIKLGGVSPEDVDSLLNTLPGLWTKKLGDIDNDHQETKFSLRQKDNDYCSEKLTFYLQNPNNNQ